MICFSVSVMFVGADNTAELPPPRNLNFIWETPFRLSLTWEKPEGLDPLCKVNYTVVVKDCSSNESIEDRRVPYQSSKLNISNVNGLCIHVSTNPESCGKRERSRSTDIIIPPPTVRLVTERKCSYSHNRMKCTWSPADGVQNLSFYYWQPVNESVIKCIPDETMKTGGCIIHDTYLKEMTEIFYLFNGTHNGTTVNNTFKNDIIKSVNKPHLTIQRKGQELHFQTNASDLDEFYVKCYRYRYNYSKCNEKFSEENQNMQFPVQYDPACKYRARVQVIFSNACGAGSSDPSDEVEYGENSDPNLSALLAVIIIPLIVSCCLLVSLVLLRRHKDIIFPKIPEPTLLFKDILINNMRTSEDLLSPAAARLYIPTEEIVESKISLEPDTPFILTMNNVPHKPQ